MPGRTWVIAPDRASLERRWEVLQAEGDPEKKELLFHPHIRGGNSGDKHVNKTLRQGFCGHEFRPGSVASDTGAMIRPVRYGYRSFDRQWIIPDGRLINQQIRRSGKLIRANQVYMTALHRSAPTKGPAVTFSAAIPDLDHYKGSFGGRVFPLWADRKHQTPNLKEACSREVAASLSVAISARDMMAYFAGIAAHPAYTTRFQSDLVQPGLRFPMTTDAKLFAEAIEIGREIVWLHCLGERFADPSAGRPKSPPRMPESKPPDHPEDWCHTDQSGPLPDLIEYDTVARRLKIGDGFIDNVQHAVWKYNVSGKQVLVQWFSYRRFDRSRPIIGDRRQPSPLEESSPTAGWPSTHGTDERAPRYRSTGRTRTPQADLLNRICDGPLLSADVLRVSGASDVTTSGRSRRAHERQGNLLGAADD